MQKDISSWNIVIAAFVTGCILLLGIFNVLLWLRRKFPIKVNCWFCNTNSWVPYKQFNSFVCKSCQQYNGFTDQGDYNQRIQAQYSTHLNKEYCKREPALDLVKAPSNGFCEYCSRNQELKIVQLANFRPRYEENYDAECEEYKQKLEDAYQLCPPCQRILNRTLNRVKSKFIGSKLAQLKKKMNEHVLILNSGPKLTPTLLAVVALLLSLMSLRYDLNFDFLNNLTIWQKLNAFCVTTFDKISEGWLDMNLSDINIDKLSLCAIVFNFFLMDQRKTRSQTVLSMLLWSLRMASNEFFNSDNFYELKVFISSLLIVNSVAMIVKSRKNEEHNASFVNITNQEETTDEESEVEIDCKSVRSNNTSFQQKSHTSFHQSSPKISDETYSVKNFSITKEVNAADRKLVHHDLNKLTLTDSQNSAFATSSAFNSTTSNPFAPENYRSVSPAPSLSNSIFTSVSQTNLFSPPRLHAPQVYAATKDDTLRSWVAGGYWANLPKRFLETPHTSSGSSSTSGVGTNDTHPSLDKSFNRSLLKPASTSSQYSWPKIFNDQHHSTILSPLPMRNNHSIFHSQFNNSFKKYREGSTFKKIV